MSKTKIKTDNMCDYHALLIKYEDITKLDWTDPNYTSYLLNIDIYDKLTLSDDTFPDIIKTYLVNDLYKSPSIKTVMVCAEKDYYYELLYIEELDNENKIHLEKYINYVAKMINNIPDDIYFNALLFKIQLNITNNDTLFIDITKIDIKDILYDRIFPKIIIYDEDWKECRLNECSNNLEYDLNNYCKNFFNDIKYEKSTIEYLAYNLDIYFSESKNSNKLLFGLLTNDIDKCIIINKYNEEQYLNITLDEIKKILLLASKKKNINISRKYLDNDEYDVKGRIIINTKYKILMNEYNKI